MSTVKIYPFKPGQGDLGEHKAKSKRVNSELGKNSLTEKQQTILDFIRDHIESVGYPPTVRQIATYYSISAKAAHDHVRAIARKGYINLSPGFARGIELVKDEEDLVETVTIPLLGRIAAGVPILAEENIDEKIALPKSFVPPTGNMFALQVKGDSMEKAGIFDGDIAVLRQVTNYAIEVRDGDIVAALIDGSATLKTYRAKGKQLFLQPENDRYSNIPLTGKDPVSIVGKLSGIYRKY